MRNKAFLAMRKHLVEKAKEKRIPLVGHFELTGRCNPAVCEIIPKLVAAGIKKIKEND